QRQVKHLTCLMDDLLDVSRISNGRIQLRPEVLDLATVLSHAAETVAPLMEEHQHRLDLQLPKTRLWVKGDPVRLIQVLGNLLTNAAKYMENGGLIELKLEAEGDSAVIRVRDYGVGIPEDLIGSMFELFVQAPTALNRAQGGLGIGLALVRALVHMHGGSTHVHSDGPGTGAEFSVRLPLTSAPADSPQENPTVVESDAASARVIIIDDNEDSAEGLALCLEAEGFQVAVCYTGGSGIDKVLATRPEVVLLDIGLPDMDGCDVAIRLRADPQLEGLRIIAMTGYGGQSDQQRAREAGFDHYLVKPVDYAELRKILASRKALASA